MTVRENLEMGAFQRRDRPASRRTSTASSRSSRASQERQSSRPARCRAASSRCCDRPRADGAPEAAAARRAVDGPRADPRRADLRDHRARSTRRARRSCSSSRTPAWRSRSPTAATCSRRGRCARRRREGAEAERAFERPTSARSSPPREPGSAARESDGQGRQAAALAGTGLFLLVAGIAVAAIVHVVRTGGEDVAAPADYRRGDVPGPQTTAGNPLRCRRSCRSPASCARRAVSSGGPTCRARPAQWA